MDIISALLIFLAIISIFISVLFIIHIRDKEKETFKQIDEMLEKAINNSFQVTTYDETRLSSAASKLNRFLIISKSSRRNIEEERAKLKELVTDVSHQTKTPISSIILYSQLLQEQEKISIQSYKLADEIVNQSEKLNFLIQALVKISRLESGIINVNPINSSINELINNSVKAVVHKAEDKNIAVNISLKENFIAFFDVKWTEEAIVNILDNAVKYTPNGGTISVSATKFEFFTGINISDNGIGIEKNEVTKIFKRFYRSNNVSQHEGVGVGLYLAREILSSEGGYIKVKTEIGKGSIFSVFLPNIRNVKSFKTVRFMKEP